MNRSRPPKNGHDSQQPNSVNMLNQSIADLEARIDALNNRGRQPAARHEATAPTSDRGIRQRMADQDGRAPQQPLPQRQSAQRAQQPQTRAAPSAAMRETSGAMREIADALVSLRNDMRRDVDEIKTITGSAAMPNDVRDDLARLATQIEAFENARIGEHARAGNDSSVLQNELDELRTLVNDLAREDTMQRLENRWDGFEERISDLDPKAVREELITLSYRIDDIKSSIGQLPSVLPIHALEDKIKMLVAAIDAMARQPASADPEIARQFALLDDRLDEISRAIVATSTAQATAVDREVVERLETRLDSLVDRIGQIGKSNQTQIGQTNQAHNELSERMESLTRRVEELTNEEALGALAERLDILTHTLTKQSAPDPILVSQLDEVARKVDSIDLDIVNTRLSEQLGELSLRIDNINTDLTATNSNQDTLYARFEQLADRVEENTSRPPVVDLGPLEMRLAKIAARMDEQLAPQENDDEAIRALEDQIAGLSQLLSDPAPQPESASVLEPRLAAIEDHLSASHSDSQDLVIEAARQAAETAIASYQQNGASAADMSAFESMVGDLRSLEDLSRKSEERSARTIDAVHDTLLKIANRLEKLEDTTTYHAPEPHMHEPVMSEPTVYETAMHEPPALNVDGDADRYEEPLSASSGYSEHETSMFSSPEYPQEAADEAGFFPDQDQPELDEEAESRSLLSGLKDRISGGSRSNITDEHKEHALQNVHAAPSIDPVGDIDPETANMPLEPGSGAPDIKRIMAKVREAQNLAGDDSPFASEAEQAKTEKADFIAAARRAAQAAASEAADIEAAAMAEDANRPTLKAKVSNRRKPILLAAGAILLAVISYPLLSGFIGGQETAVKSASVDKPAVVEPVTKPVVEPVMEAASDLPKVQVVETDPFDSVDPTPTPAPVATPEPAPTPVGTPDITQAPAPRQIMSSDNEIQPSSSFQPAEPVAETKIASLTTEMPPQAVEIELPPEAVGPLALREAAAKGDGLALFEVGARYTDGRGVPVDLSKAAKWYKLSADMGFAPAQYRLANFYEKGSGVERDVGRALTWYQLAAEQGNASAMHNLAVLYAMVREGVADYESAGTWFTRAADLGVKDSQFNLAILHARGSGVEQDLEESYKWFAIAAKAGDKDASKKRDEVANALRPEQLESARAKVELWKPGALVESANSVRIPPEWRGTETRTASVDMTKAVRNIQAILTKNGFDTGGIDGIMGNRTVEAIKAFQASVGLAPTGEVSDALVKELMARNY
ncbi:MAG: hemagglutinin [Hyphomicrobiales bacterium]|nr:hemagglutinin [Hyphomicrobiales bacterium]